MTYEIRYNHRSTQTATSKDAALRMARKEANASRLVHVPCDDGLYLYRSTEDRDRDTDGSRAYAVICTPEPRA